MIVMAPSDEAETFKLLSTGFEYKGPTAVRYPRGKGPGAQIPQSLETVAIGKGISRREGKTVAILAFGSMVRPALAAAEELNATVIDMRFVKPLDEELIGGMATTHKLIVTVEENTVLGGAGSAVNEFLLQENYQISVLNLGLPDKFLDHGKVPQMLENAGLDSKSITTAIQNKLQACKVQSEGV